MSKAISLENLQKFKEKCDETYAKIGGSASTNENIVVKTVSVEELASPINFTTEEIETLKNTSYLILRIQMEQEELVITRDMYMFKDTYIIVGEMSQFTYSYITSADDGVTVTITKLVISNNVGTMSDFNLAFGTNKEMSSIFTVSANSVVVVEFNNITSKDSIIIKSVGAGASTMQDLIISQPYYNGTCWCVNVYNNSASERSNVQLEVLYQDYNR